MNSCATTVWVPMPECLGDTSKNGGCEMCYVRPRGTRECRERMRLVSDRHREARNRKRKEQRATDSLYDKRHNPVAASTKYELVKDNHPVCECHGEKMYWRKSSKMKEGGYWTCRIKYNQRTSLYIRTSGKEKYLSWRERTKKRARDGLITSTAIATRNMRNRRDLTKIEELMQLLSPEMQEVLRG